MSEAVQTFLFNFCCFQYSVIPFSEVYRASKVTVFIADERGVLTEVEFLAEFLNHLYRCGIERNISSAACTFQLADFDFSAWLSFSSISFGYFFDASLQMDNGRMGGFWRGLCTGPAPGSFTEICCGQTLLISRYMAARARETKSR